MIYTLFLTIYNVTIPQTVINNNITYIPTLLLLSPVFGVSSISSVLLSTDFNAFSTVILFFISPSNLSSELSSSKPSKLFPLVGCTVTSSSEPSFELNPFSSVGTTVTSSLGITVGSSLTLAVGLAGVNGGYVTIGLAVVLTSSVGLTDDGVFVWSADGVTVASSVAVGEYDCSTVSVGVGSSVPVAVAVTSDEAVGSSVAPNV